MVYVRGENFNPRTREGCDNRRARTPRFAGYFNPRTREGCDGIRFYRIIPFFGFQSTHPRGVRLSNLQQIVREHTISIHAPARGATITVDDAGNVMYNFNPRTREGCDVDDSASAAASIPISIHAPARGATVLSPREKRKILNFNPRTREGCDDYPQNFQMYATIFQSTHPRGVRLQSDLKVIAPPGFQSTHPRGVRPSSIVPASSALIYFNPRTREGCDLRTPNTSSDLITISIHAPARGATVFFCKKTHFFIIFVNKNDYLIK